MSTAATAEFNTNQPLAADERDRSLPLRNDTILGVCEATGQDLGFHPNFLRIPFAALLLWNPAVVIGAYLGLGCIVALSRWFFPVAKTAAVGTRYSESESGSAQASDDRDDESEERLAA